MIFSFTTSPTHGQKKPTYRDGIFKEVPTRIHEICLSAWRSRRQSRKEDKLPKILNMQKMTLPVLAGRKREDHPHHHPTPIRAVLASARETILAIRVMRRPVKKVMPVSWPRALFRRI